jgi:hypothetical protein
MKNWGRVVWSIKELFEGSRTISKERTFRKSSPQVAKIICRLRKIYYYTVPKIWQISVSKEEEVPCRENFPVIFGNSSPFPRITGKFSLQGTSSLIFSEICIVFGTE